MRTRKIVVAALMLAATVGIAGCRNERPGHWGDHHHGGHHGGHHDRDDRH